MPRRPMSKKKRQEMFRQGSFAIESYDQHPEYLKRIKIKVKPFRLKKRDKRIYEVKREEEQLDD
jgi:hypothetical protein